MAPSNILKQFPSSLPKISHRNELTKKTWENATQGQGKAFSLYRCWAVRMQLLDVLAQILPKSTLRCWLVLVIVSVS